MGKFSWGTMALMAPLAVDQRTVPAEQAVTKNIRANPIDKKIKVSVSVSVSSSSVCTVNISGIFRYVAVLSH